MSLLIFVYKARSFLVLSNSMAGSWFSTSFQAGKTLSARKWHAAFSPDGCLDIASVLSRIQRGVRFLIFWSYCFSVSYMLLVLQMSNYILSVMFTPINMIYLLLGCASNSQGEVWEFLLGCFDPRSTFDEREEIRQIRRYLLPCGLLRYTFYLLRGKRLDKSGSLNFERETN